MKTHTIVFLVSQICLAVVLDLMAFADDGNDVSRFPEFTWIVAMAIVVGACGAALWEGMADTSDRRRFLFCLVGPGTALVGAVVTAVVLAPAMESVVVLLPMIMATVMAFAPTWAAIGLGAYIRTRRHE